MHIEKHPFLLWEQLEFFHRKREREGLFASLPLPAEGVLLEPFCSICGVAFNLQLSSMSGRLLFLPSCAPWEASEFETDPFLVYLLGCISQSTCSLQWN